MIASASLPAFSGLAAAQRAVSPVAAAVTDIVRQKSAIGAPGAPPAGQGQPGQPPPGQILPRGSLLDRSV